MSTTVQGSDLVALRTRRPREQSVVIDLAALDVERPIRHSTEVVRITEVVAEHPLFDQALSAQLPQLILEGAVEVLDVPRDRALEHTDSILFVCKGQVGLGVFDEQSINERRLLQHQLRDHDEESQSLLPLPPLAHTAKKNLANFSAGELFNASALALEGGEELAMFSLTPAVLLAFRADALARLVVRFPTFGERISQALSRAERRLRSARGVKQDLLDFFIRNGLSVAGPLVRVRQLDLCIDCKQCEDACEERHGARRLTLGGFQLGMLDFVFSCRTCADPRCLSGCEHDSIKFDAEKKEVVIDHGKCIGCSLCAQSCPYGAIEMVNIADEEQPTYSARLKKRLDQAGHLKRAKPVRRIANKCDHCAGYAEQACVSACPTGSLIELDVGSLFHLDVDRSNPQDKKKEVLPLEPFTRGIGIKDAGLARVRHRQFSKALWVLGLFAWFAVVVEIYLRFFLPTRSMSYLWDIHNGIEPGVALLNVSFLAGSEVALACGYVGTALMVLSMAYPLQRRFRWFSGTASNKFWLDVHLMTGTVGPLFIVLHSALRLDNWVSIPFWSMIMVVGSGFLGRYFYTLVPSMLSGHELEVLHLQGRIANLTTEYPEAGRMAQSEADARVQAARSGTAPYGLFRLFFWFLWDDLTRRSRARGLRRQLKRFAPRRVARELASTCDRLVMFERRASVGPRARMFLKPWKRVHVPFTFLLLVTMVLHIVLALLYSM